ncbi:hypothetical protein [Chitinophaga sp.]|uniref:hypothetical protein n=1 Tax=Chitinophaga sp. TaxID=1869181 RepID=UPI0031DFE834
MDKRLLLPSVVVPLLTAGIWQMEIEAYRPVISFGIAGEIWMTGRQHTLEVITFTF